MTKQITPNELSRLFFFVDHISIQCSFPTDSIKENKENLRNRTSLNKPICGIPTIFTPVPSEASTVILEEAKRHIKNPGHSSCTDNFNKKNNDNKKKKKSNLKCMKMSTSLKTLNYKDGKSSSKNSLTKKNQNQNSQLKTRASDADLFSSKSSEQSYIDTELLRTTLPVQLFFMQKRIGSLETPCDETLRSLIQFALDRVSNRINNQFSFFVYGSIYDINWKRPVNALMKTPVPENLFRVLFKPKLVDKSLQEINKIMNIDAMRNLNLYIFIKELNEETIIQKDGEESKHWFFNNVYG